MLEHRVYHAISKFDIGFLEGLEVDGLDCGNEVLLQGGLESVVLFEDYARAVVRVRLCACGHARGFERRSVVR